MLNWLLLLFKPLFLWITDGNWRAYHWLLIRFGDIKDQETQIVYARSFRLEVNQMQAFLSRFKLFFVYRLLLFKRRAGIQPIIVDLAAGEGLGPAFFSEAYPDSKVYCWEADPSQRDLLIRNMDSTRYKPVEVLSAATIHEVMDQVKGLEIKSFDLLKTKAEDLGLISENQLRKFRHLFVHCTTVDQMATILQRLKAEGFDCQVVSEGSMDRPFLQEGTNAAYLVLASPST